jgi:hypothetical protein
VTGKPRAGARDTLENIMEEAQAYFEEKVAKDFQKSIARGVGKKGPAQV